MPSARRTRHRRATSARAAASSSRDLGGATISGVLPVSDFGDGDAAWRVVEALQALAAAEDRAEHLEEALRSSRQIGMALGILMERHRWTEDQAFDCLRTESQRRNVKLRTLAEHLVLTASGQGKATAVAAAVEGALSASCPASVLQLHPHATVVIDEAAATELERADYYRYTLEHKLRHQPY